MNFFWVDRQKMINENLDELDGRMSQYDIDETKAKSSAIWKNYMSFACERCKEFKLNDRWSTKSVVAMAKEVGFMFTLIRAAYYHPHEQVRPQPPGLLDWIELDSEEPTFVNELPDLHSPDAPLQLAHWLALHTLFVLGEHFSIDALEDPLSKCISDFYSRRLEK
jgi:hypothetical protein